MTVLNVLMQNPEASFEDVVGSAVTLKTKEETEEEEAPAEKRRAFTPEEIDI